MRLLLTHGDVMRRGYREMNIAQKLHDHRRPRRRSMLGTKALRNSVGRHQRLEQALWDVKSDRGIRYRILINQISVRYPLPPRPSIRHLSISR
jgi:hypothetical protein